MYIDYRYWKRYEPTIPMGCYSEEFFCRGFGCGMGEDCPMPDDYGGGGKPIMIEPIEDEL